MKEKPRGSKVPKRTEEKWGTGDMGDNDAELFKHLPDPKDLVEEGARRTKKKVKKDRGSN